VGIEPTNKGFADLCLTTWLPRPTEKPAWAGSGGTLAAAPIRFTANPRIRTLRGAIGSGRDDRNFLERETGLEPATSTLARSHSTN
jgi:hypothetical protein